MEAGVVKIPFLVRPQVLVVTSWIIAAGMFVDAAFWRAHWFGAFGVFSAMEAAFILGMWSWPETRPVRTKQWWALLFIVDLWGSTAGMWLRYESNWSFAAWDLVTAGVFASLHAVLSFLVWRDHLIRSDGTRPVTHP